MPSNFGEKLKAIRKAAKLTQAQLAERAGCKQAAISMWEAGERDPGWSEVQALALALGVDCTAFTDAPEPKPGKPAEPRGPKEGEHRGVGVIRANEAINCLIRIPKDDARQRAFDAVLSWIETPSKIDLRAGDDTSLQQAQLAIGRLQSIPRKDALRDRAFEIVSDWIKSNGPRTH